MNDAGFFEFLQSQEKLTKQKTKKISQAVHFSSEKV